MSRRSTFRLLAALLLVLAGAAAAVVADTIGRGPPPDDERVLWNVPFHLVRKATDPLRITPARWLEIPWLYGDFDLDAEVELGPDMQLGVLVRRVEPRVHGEVRPLFQGRFSLLTLSTAGAGPAWRSRDEAVLDDSRGGLELQPGYPTTLWIRARGRRIEANVAGRRLEPHLALDEHGSLALFARGGAATVRSLNITPIATAPSSFGVEAWLLGAAAGLLLALGGLLAGAGVVRLCIAAVAVVAGALVGSNVVASALPPLARATAAHSHWIASLGVPLALALLLPRRARIPAALFALLAAVAAVVAIREAESQRFAASPEVDALFGEQAGDGLAEALAQRIRGAGPSGVHTVEEREHRALLLGGRLLYERGASPEDHVAVQLRGELARHFGSADAAEVVPLPTIDGHARQQWQMFTRFFTGFRPEWIVFGIPRDEAAPGADGEPRSSPHQLARVLDQVRGYCAQRRIGLVLLADAGLPDALREVVRAAATGEVRLCEIQPDQGAGEIAATIAEALVAR